MTVPTQDHLEELHEPYGKCQCGCGEDAPISGRNRYSGEVTKSEPMKFVNGHQSRGRFNPNWKGGISPGYVARHNPDHPAACEGGRVLEHHLVVYEVTGRTLPDGAVVHHVNGDPSDNRPENLVVCEDAGYHNLLHIRERALEACGDPAKRKCWICGEWDDPENLDYRERNGTHRHLSCHNEYMRNRAS